MDHGVYLNREIIESCGGKIRFYTKFGANFKYWDELAFGGAVLFLFLSALIIVVNPDYEFDIPFFVGCFGLVWFFFILFMRFLFGVDWYYSERRGH
jgi:hypothetical protein